MKHLKRMAIGLAVFGVAAAMVWFAVNYPFPSFVIVLIAVIYIVGASLTEDFKGCR